MPISCHFRDCKALLDMNLTHISSAIASTLWCSASICVCVCQSSRNCMPTLVSVAKVMCCIQCSLFCYASVQFLFVVILHLFVVLDFIVLYLHVQVEGMRLAGLSDNTALAMKLCKQLNDSSVASGMRRYVICHLLFRRHFSWLFRSYSIISLSEQFYSGCQCLDHS